MLNLATLPNNKFEKEGIIQITEKREGLFRKTEVSFARWRRLRGNLLFYLKDEDPFSTPMGLIVLENCRPVIRNAAREADEFAFILEFADGNHQRLATNTETERSEWVHALAIATYDE